MKALVALVVVGCIITDGQRARGGAGKEGPRAPELKAVADYSHPPPIGQPGRVAQYTRESSPPASVVKTYTLALGPVENRTGQDCQWIVISATKVNGQTFRIWLLSAGYPSETLTAARPVIVRYILQEGASEPLEFRDRFTGVAVLPTLVDWKDLLPRSSLGGGVASAGNAFPPETSYLGHRYRQVLVKDGAPPPSPSGARTIELMPEVVIGLASNTRQKDETRRYDGSDYKLIKLTRQDYHDMIDAGVTCLKVDAEQLPWVEHLNAFYWGVGAGDLPYPECLYRSSYLGPVIFLDEPAVGTRDHVIRPRLEKDAAFRKALTPQLVFAAFKDYFRNACQEGAPTTLRRQLVARSDVDLGNMDVRQGDLFSWETMVASAAYELSQDPRVPAAMVFEPPGRVGTLRTLPELDMTYGCQLPVDDPKNLTSIIYGFLRGAARLTDKEWGTSIYGAVDRADAFWFLTHAYDLGATRFFFWDNSGLACVPFGECLALARNLRTHAESHPRPDLQRLRQAAEVAILLPPGYNLGHVHLGKGSLWGLGELNLERVNRAGAKYRLVMSNFFAEIERCLRLGVAFDLLWDLPGIQPTGYREVVRIREDGKVEVTTDGQGSVMSEARAPARPAGAPPRLDISLSTQAGKAPLDITARASVVETTAPVYYTFGADPQGICRNTRVAWELYGPGDEDYRFLTPSGLKPEIREQGNTTEVLVHFRLDRPGNYRLRAATVDLAGRTTVRWTPIDVAE
ncbi:MAG: hypothetical protein ACYDH9_27620 [Limisphaerales bacterium]